MFPGEDRGFGGALYDAARLNIGPLTMRCMRSIMTRNPARRIDLVSAFCLYYLGYRGGKRISPMHKDNN
jgi:hypothetical protein